MKRLILNILVIWYVVLLLGCMKDPQVSPEEMLYGTKDTISFEMSYSLAGIRTRSLPAETLVENVNIYIVNELGDLITSGYYTSSSPVQVVVLKKMKYTVYAVANAGKEIQASTAAAIEGMEYDITDISQMTSRSGAVLMSGKSVPQFLTDGKQLVVDLVRCVSRIVVKTDDSLLNPDVSIQVNSVQLKNIPRKVKIFSASKIAGTNDVLDGETVKNPVAGELASGLVFYQYENKQGTLQPGNLDPVAKVWPADNIYSRVCSYVEMQAAYASSRKRGAVIYRFYLGTDMVANYDVIRNTQHTVVVCFKGDGAVEENTWRVDHSDIVDLVTSVVLNPGSYGFTVLGETLQLTASVFPLTAANKEIEWSSSDEQVAVVDKTGKVTAKGDGCCMVTAASTDGTNIQAVCPINVDSKIYVAGIEVEPEALELYIGEKSRLIARILPSDASVPDVLWSSSDAGVVVVDASGEIEAVGAGHCTVTATSKDDEGKKATCRVTVKSKEFSIAPSSKTLYAGESFTISYTVAPPQAPVFVSETPAVACVDVSGKVTALAAGTARIKVTAHGKEEYCIVMVVSPQIEFPASGRVMYDGEVVTVPYAVLVPASFVPEVTAGNSRAEVTGVTAAGIKIRANSPGICVITAKMGPVTATYTLDIQLLRIVFEETAPVVLFQGFHDPLHYTVYPTHARNLAVTLRSADEARIQIVDNETVQGGIPSASPVEVTAGFPAFPEKKYAVNCIVKPAITVSEKSVELLTGISPYSTPVTDPVYRQYKLTIDKHPRARVKWILPYTDIQVSGDGVITPGTAGNGKYPDAAVSGREKVPVTAVVTGDDGMTSFSDQVSAVIIYENALVYGRYQESTTGAIDPADPYTIEFVGNYDEMSDKLQGDDPYPYRYDSVYFWDSYSYPMANQNFAVSVAPEYRRIVGTSFKTKGRYFYITTLKDVGYYR